MRVGIAHHLGWAVAVTASDEHEVVDRRRIELLEPGLPSAPVHHDGGPHEMHRTGDPLDDDALAALVAEVRASCRRTTSVALDGLAASVSEPIASLSLRAWPDDFPDDIAVVRGVPYESRADSVMYRKLLAEAALARGWEIHCYGADVVDDASRLLGARADAVLSAPRARFGPPWNKDHRMALAATVVLG